MQEFIIRKGFIALDDSQISGSLSVTNAVTGSVFSGSFVGDGSQLLGIDGFPFTGSAEITGSLTVTGSVSATSFVGDGSQLSGIDGFPFTGSAAISGSLVVDGDITASSVVADSFTGSLQGAATSALTAATASTAVTASYVNLPNVDGFTAYSASVSTSISSVLDATTPITATVNNTNSPYTVTNETIVIVDSTNGDITVNLPDLDTVVGTPNQRPIIIYKNDYSQNVVYVQPNGAELINGTTEDIIVSLQIGIVYNPTSAGWVTEGNSYQSLAELELFFVPRTETGSLSVATASYVEYTDVANKPALVSSSAQIEEYGIFATTGSNYFTGSQAITGSLTVTGEVIAQTLNVQQVTSSIVYSSGSNTFGNDLGNTQQLIGSVDITGSLDVIGTGTFSGNITGNSGIINLQPSTTTNGAYSGYLNDGGQLYLGIDNSAGSLFGKGAYAYNFYGNANRAMVFSTDGTTRLTIAGTGAATFSSSVNVGGDIQLNSTFGTLKTSANNSVLVLLANPSLVDNEVRIELVGRTYPSVGNSIYYRGATQIFTSSTASTEYMRITSGGNVGIGTTNPSGKLHVEGTTLTQGLYIPGLTTLPNVQGAIQISIPDASYNAIRFYDTTGAGANTIHGFASNWAGGASPGHLNLEGVTAVSFGTWVSPNMIVHHSTGYVGIGIGDATPKTTLQLGRVFGFLQDINSGYIDCNRAADGTYIVSQYAARIHLDSALGEIKFSNAPSGTAGNAVSLTERMRITSGGNVGIGTTNPPVQLNVSHASHGLGFAYIGGSALPSIAGLFTDTGVNGGQGYGSLQIKSRSDYAGYSINFFTAASSNTPLERMRITSGGDLQMNYNPGGGSLYFRDTTNGAVMFYVIPATYVGTAPFNSNRFLAANSSHISFETGGAEHMRITSAGYVTTDFTSATNGGLIANGIEYSIKTVGSLSGYTQGAIVLSSGTDSVPSARGQGIFYFNEGNDITWYSGGLYVSTDRFDICRKTGTSDIDTSTAQAAYSLFNLNSSGAAYNATGTWGTISSDQRLKENIIDATPKLNDVLSLQVRNFNYIGKDEKYIGFIAQELEEVFPSLVTTNDTREYDRDGNVVGGMEDTKGVKVGMDFAILVKAIQEQQTQIESLKAEIQTLRQ